MAHALQSAKPSSRVGFPPMNGPRPPVSKGGVKDAEYKALLKSIEAALRVIGDRPTGGPELKVFADLMRLRETVIRARRDEATGTSGRRDSRSPLGVP
jgi:hypothetical protein